MPFLQFRHGMVGRILTAAWCVLLGLALVMPALGLVAEYKFDKNVWQPIDPRPVCLRGRRQRPADSHGW